MPFFYFTMFFEFFSTNFKIEHFHAVYFHILNSQPWLYNIPVCCESWSKYTTHVYKQKCFLCIFYWSFATLYLHQCICLFRLKCIFMVAWFMTLLKLQVKTQNNLLLLHLLCILTGIWVLHPWTLFKINQKHCKMLEFHQISKRKNPCF